jgi:predicted DNA-binding transcriptional regulator AlpA
VNIADSRPPKQPLSLAELYRASLGITPGQTRQPADPQKPAEPAAAPALKNKVSAANLADVADRIGRIEAAIDRRPGDKLAEILARLAVAGLEPTIGKDDWEILLGVSRRAIDRMLARRDLPPPDFRLGRSPRWRSESAKNWLGAQRGTSR